MVFNSYSFLFIFFPLSVVIYFVLNRTTTSAIGKIFLIICSCYFYQSLAGSNLYLLLGSITINYICGYLIHEFIDSSARRKFLLYIGILSNLSLLIYFKYTYFIVDNINSFLSTPLFLHDIILPLGISFYTFQQIAYLVDCYRNNISGNRFFDYCLFVSFYPQIVQGPIVYQLELTPQFNKPRNWRHHWDNIAKGLFIFSIGLAKKILVADQIAEFVNYGFSHPEGLDFFAAWATSLGYTLQIYFDFSGYMDMALGVGYCFNVSLPSNFNSPYKALSIQDFWRRWHITLTRFLREFVYIPIGGNRRGRLRTYLNIFITFLIGGIWHGAGWTFLFWGFFHALGCVGQRLWENTGIRLPKIIAWFLTFNFINVTWILFRAESLDTMKTLVRSMAGLNSWHMPEFSALMPSNLVQQINRLSDVIEKTPQWGSCLIVIAVLLSFCLIYKNSVELVEHFQPKPALALIIALLAVISTVYIDKSTQFIYYQF